MNSNDVKTRLYALGMMTGFFPDIIGKNSFNRYVSLINAKTNSKLFIPLAKDMTKETIAVAMREIAASQDLDDSAIQERYGLREERLEDALNLLEDAVFVQQKQYAESDDPKVREKAHEAITLSNICLGRFTSLDDIDEKTKDEVVKNVEANHEALSDLTAEKEESNTSRGQ